MGGVLVTGGLGFIGSHFVNLLNTIQPETRIIIVDNLMNDNVQSIKKADKLFFINGDITDEDLMNQLIQKNDIIVHFAAISNVMSSIKDPATCFRINAVGTEILARLCSKYKKKLVFLSSREVYGNANYIPVNESHEVNPINPYGASKLSGEKTIISYSICYGLKYAILRLANVYGEGDVGRVVPTFINNVLSDKDIVIYGPDKIIDLIHVEDVIRAIFTAMNLEENCLVNIGCGEGIDISDLVENIFEIIGVNKEIIIKSNRVGEVNLFVADIHNAKKILNWAPRISFKEGLGELILSLKNNIYCS